MSKITVDRIESQDGGFDVIQVLNHTLPFSKEVSYPAGSLGEAVKASSGLEDKIINDDFITTEYVNIVGENGKVSRSLKAYLNTSKSFYLQDYLTDEEIAASRSNSPVDVTVNFKKAIEATVASLPATLFLGQGTFLVDQTQLPNLAISSLQLIGSGIKETKIKLTASGEGLNFDAFQSNSSSSPFCQNLKLSNFTIEGNAQSTSLINAQGIARANFDNISLREGRNSDCVALKFRGVMLSRFSRVFCSTDLQAMTNIPREGIRLDEGRRAGTSVGNSSNNVFEGCYFEGLPIGVRVLLGDQNLFLGGSPESCTVYGLLIGSGSRYNTFIGVGFENISATADVADGGISSRFINCYASNSFIMQGRDCKLEGGYFERIEVEAGSKSNYIGGVTINHWQTTHGGFFDNGTGTRYGSIYNSITSTYIYPKKARTSITVTASPFKWTNSLGVTAEVILQGGTVTQIRKGDGTGDLFLTGAAGTHLLLAGDEIEVSYSSAPSMSVRTLNGV